MQDMEKLKKNSWIDVYDMMIEDLNVRLEFAESFDMLT